MDMLSVMAEAEAYLGELATVEFNKKPRAHVDLLDSVGVFQSCDFFPREKERESVELREAVGVWQPEAVCMCMYQCAPLCVLVSVCLCVCVSVCACVCACSYIHAGTQVCV
jgi:hypothetical protein